MLDVKDSAPLWLALVLALTTITSAQPQRFALAIVRFDGRLIPFAAYDNGRWERAWPQADEGIDQNGKLLPVISTVWRRRGIHVPTVWHVWPVAGGRPIEAHTKGLEVVDAHCAVQVALATDLPEKSAEHPLKFGVATDSELRLGTIQDVPRPGAAWSIADRLVKANFAELEAKRAQTDRESRPRESPAPPVRITQLYREANTPDSPMFFVAEKRYRRPRNPQDRDCGALTIITGWLVLTQAGTWTLWDPKVFLTDCDAKEAREAWPMASLEVSGRLFWVLQEHGYEDETYIVAEIGPSAVRYRIDVSGGGC